MDIFSISVERIVPPNITLHPLWEGEFEASPVRLICTLSGYFPDGLTVEWKQDNQHLTNVGTQKKLQSVEKEKNTFSLSSEIVPNITEWAGGSMYTCKSVQKNTEFIKTISICQRKYSYYFTAQWGKKGVLMRTCIDKCFFGSCSPCKCSSLHPCGDPQLQDCNDGRIHGESYMFGPHYV